MLTLPIKRKWFDMIVSGEKKEEYRDITPYYTKRFETIWGPWLVSGGKPQTICLRAGYGSDAPTCTVDCTVDTGKGKPKWGAEAGKKYYRLKIHKVHVDRKKLQRSVQHEASMSQGLP